MKKQKKPDPLKMVPDPSCHHPHFKFDHYGSAMKCVDCKREWKPISMDAKVGGVIDILYYDVTNANATRHSPFETPRFGKKRA